MGLFESKEEKKIRLEKEKQQKEKELKEFMEKIELRDKEEELRIKEEELYENRYNIKGNYVTEDIYGSSYENLIININKYYAELIIREIKFDIVNINIDNYAISEYSRSREGRFFEHIEKTETTAIYQFVAAVTIKIKE